MAFGKNGNKTVFIYDFIGKSGVAHAVISKEYIKVTGKKLLFMV